MLLVFSGLVEFLIFEFFPVVFGFAGEFARQGFDGDVVVGAEGAPKQKARVELSGLVGDFIRHRLIICFLVLGHVAFVPRSLESAPARGASSIL